MRIKLIRTQSCTDGLNTMSGIPIHFHDDRYTLEYNRIKMGTQSIFNPSPYKEFEFISGQWLKNEYYIVLMINIKDIHEKHSRAQMTFTGKNFFYNVILWIKYSKWIKMFMLSWHKQCFKI